MLGFVDEWRDAGVVAASLTAMIVAARTFLAAWRSCKRRLSTAWSTAVDASNTAHLVRHHLGPNGETTPMHQRMARLERAHDIEDLTTQGDAPWGP
jgi:hypothetical protein